MKQDLFQAPDYYNLDELLTEEHKLIRNSAREWVKKSVSPIIEEYAQKAKFPDQLIKGLADIGAFGPYIPEEYGGLGMGFVSTMITCEYISSGNGSLSTAFGAHTGIGTLPILLYGDNTQRKKY